MTRQTLLKIVIFALILAFYASLLAHKINLPTDDLGRHLKNGELILNGVFGNNWGQVRSVLFSNFYSYTAPDFPFLNHHWLSGVVFYLLFKIAGFSGLVIFKIVLLLAGLALLFSVAAKKGNFWLAALFSVPVIFILGERTDVRPEIFSYFFTALFLYLLFDFQTRPERRRVFWLIPLQLLWVNLHIFFFIGLALVGGMLFERIILNFKNLKRDIATKKLAFLFLALVMVSFLNPAPIKTALYPSSILKSYGYDIVENQSPLFLENLMHDPAILAFKIMLAGLALSFFAAIILKKRPIFWFLASLATAAASFSMVRNLPFFGLIALPSAAINFSGLYEKLAAWFKEKKPRAASLFAKTAPLALAAVFVILVIFGGAGRILKNKEPGLGLAPESNAAADFFKTEDLAGPIFNNYDIGSYVLWHLFPKEKVFVDNRPETYPVDFFTKIYIPMQYTETIWQEQLEKYNFNTIFFTAQEGTWWGRKFLAARLEDKDWSLIFADSQALIFLRDTPQNKELIERFRITKENIDKKIAYLKNSGDTDEKLSAINLFGLLGRDDLAEETLQEILVQEPKNGRAWLELGYLKSKKSGLENFISATDNIKKAIELGEDFPSVYDQLGLLYFSRNMFTEAKKAWQKALDIDSSDAGAKDYLEQYQKLNLP